MVSWTIMTDNIKQVIDSKDLKQTFAKLGLKLTLSAKTTTEDWYFLFKIFLKCSWEKSFPYSTMSTKSNNLTS